MSFSVYAALQNSTEAYPNCKAVTYVDPDILDLDDVDPDHIRYQKLFADVTALANGFRALSDKDCPVVSLMLPSSIPAVTALMAAQCAGIAHPVNFFLGTNEIAASLREVGTDILVTIGSHRTLPLWDKAQALKDQLPDLKAVVVIDRVKVAAGYLSMREVIAAHAASDLIGPQPAPSTIAAYYNTAGTTGKSKVVQLTHANLLAAAGALAEAWAFDHTTRIVNALPFFHVAGANLLGLGPLMAGAEMMLLSEIGLRNPAILAQHWEIVDRFEPTIIGGIPSSLTSLLEVPVNGADLSSVRFCATGGAPLPAAVAEAFEARFGLPIHAIYGMTETAGLIATRPLGADKEYTRVGQPSADTHVEIRAFQGGEIGAPLSRQDPTDGAIVVKGPQVFAGYLQADQTAATLTEDGFLITGDIGNLDADGRVMVSGRSKDVIIRSGHNIDPGDIERCAATCSGVAAAVAVAMPDFVSGDVPALFVTLKKGHSLTAAALSAHLRSNLSEPHALPTHFEILDALPITAVGKVSRLELRRRAAETALNAEIRAPEPLKLIAVTISDSGALKACVPPTCGTEDPDLIAKANATIARFGLG